MFSLDEDWFLQACVKNFFRLKSELFIYLFKYKNIYFLVSIKRVA